MAQSKKTTGKTAKRSSGNTKSSSTKKRSSAAASAPPEPVVPIRRELGGVVFFFLALMVAISYFVQEGSFVVDFSTIIKGYFGWGYWITAPTFLLISYILLFHRGRPVTLRMICAFLLPILLAAILHLFLYRFELSENDLVEMAHELFAEGTELESGGVFGGILAIGLERALSVYGAAPVLIILAIVCAIFAFNGSVKKAAAKVTIPQYDPQNYSGTLSPVMPSISGRQAAKPRKTIDVIQRSDFNTDIPLGDEEDALSISESLRKDAGRSRQASKSGRKPTITVLKEPATEGVKPLSPEEAAKIAGVDLQVYDEVKAEAETQKSAKQKQTVKPMPRQTGSASGSQKIQKIGRDEVEAEAQAVAAAVSASGEKPDYVFPPVSLLRSGTAASGDSREEILLNKERLESAIRSFGIGASIVGVIRGPTVTRYDIELEQGVKLSRVTNLAGDLALALGVVNVRIAPIPEKISTVGIEVPNKIISTVCLRDIIDTPKFSAAKSKLSFALGKDISGEGIIGNISKLPHMLIAGTTGSGKSVCMNSLILSLLYKARPDEVKLIMIDPKMVELGVYNGIPHLYVPVVTDPKKAAGALQWSVVEMLKRYRLFSDAGVRDLESYNRHCLASGEAPLPQVVIVIDELADLMMIASKDVEESICRVAQMGRAAGMHLIIATQRPSADVITGLMKANIPSRIAFAVSSALESRIILDQGGAEKLIGMGDMLFSPVGVGKPIRIQGAYVSDEEREDVIQFIKEGSGEIQKNEELETYMETAAADTNAAGSGSSAKEEKSTGGYDEMLPQAVEVVLETKSCSVSMLQRRIKLGYSRAARIVDQMEELGVVGPYEGAKPRSVVVDRDGWNEIRQRLGLVSDGDMALAAELSEESGGDYDN